jgi:hypothetical protein
MWRLMRRAAILPLVILGALAVTACGSSSSKSKSAGGSTGTAALTPSTATTTASPQVTAFRAKVNGACTKYVAPADQAIKAKNFKAAGGYLAKFVAAVDSTNPPPELKAPYAEFKGLVDKFGSQLSQGQHITVTSAQLDSAATKLGLTDCARIL